MKTIVDQATCIGCGLCIEHCPDLYEMGDDNLAKVKADPVPPDLEPCAKEAEGLCPVTAITSEP